MSSRKLSDMLLIDFEATEQLPTQEAEIIEIGVCKLNLSTMEPERKTSYLVRPKYSKLTPFITELTTITEELLSTEGIPFVDAVNKLKKDFGPKYRTWGSWGAYDRIALEKNCVMYNIDYPMGRNHINIKNLYSLKFGLKKELGMAAALEHAGIQLEGTHHRGHDDAWNTAKLMARILK